MIRSGGMKKLFDGVCACATLGIFLRQFTHGHVRQLAAVLRRLLVALAARTPLLALITDRAYIDIDSLLRPVYGKAKQGASFSHTKIAGKNILRRGLSPLAVTISTDTAAPVLAGVRLRAGRAGSSKGATSMVTEAINTAIEAGAQLENILVRGDSAFCGGKIIAAVVKAGARFSFAIARNSAVDAAINSIPDEAFVAVQYPGAVEDPDTGELISDAQVSEVECTAFADTRYEITATLVVRRVFDANTQDPLFPVWLPPVLHQQHRTDHTGRPHPPAPTPICETVWSDLIDGPWAHQPSGSFAANAAWTMLAAITHNLLRAAGTLTGTTRYAVARGATLREHIINVPARLARPQRRPVLHLPRQWPRAKPWQGLWTAVFVT